MKQLNKKFKASINLNNNKKQLKLLLCKKNHPLNKSRVYNPTVII